MEIIPKFLPKETEFLCCQSGALSPAGSSRPQVANTGPAHGIQPSTLFYPPGTLFLPGGSTQLLAPS